MLFVKVKVFFVSVNYYGYFLYSLYYLHSTDIADFVDFFCLGMK